MSHTEFYGHLAAFLSVLAWGVTFISTKILLTDFSPQEILFIRFLLGWIALWLAAPKRIRVHQPIDRLLFALAGFTGVTLYFLLENIALTYTLASNVSLIVTTAPIFTAFLAWWAGGTRPKGSFFVGCILAMIGVALVSLNGQALELNPAGDLLALLAAISWAFYSILTRKLGKHGYGSITTTREIFFWGLVLMLPILPFGDCQFGFSKLIKPVNAINLLFLGLWASALCFASWTFAIKRLGAIKSSAYIYLVPVITVAGAAIMLNEALTAFSLIGASLTIAGLCLSEGKLDLLKARNKE